jgi:hypothetical protein
MKEVYVPPFNEESFLYYLKLAQIQNALNGDFNSWSKTTQDKKAKEEYQKRLKKWHTIVERKNWNLWYNDNIGAFSVSVTVNK